MTRRTRLTEDELTLLLSILDQWSIDLDEEDIEHDLITKLEKMQYEAHVHTLSLIRKKGWWSK